MTIKTLEEKAYSVDTILTHQNRNCTQCYSVKELVDEMLFVDPYEGGAIERLQYQVEALDLAVRKLLTVAMQDTRTAGLLTDRSLFEIKAFGEDK